MKKGDTIGKILGKEARGEGGGSLIARVGEENSNELSQVLYPRFSSCYLKHFSQ